MRSHFRRNVAVGNEYPLLVDRIFAGWYEPDTDRAKRSEPSIPSLQYQTTPAPDIANCAPDIVPTVDLPEPIFHMGDTLPCEVEELKRLGIYEDRIAEMWGRFSPERIAKILGVTVSQVRIAAAWSRRTTPLPAVVTCGHCGISHPPQLQSLDYQPVCSEVCQIELNAHFEAAHAPLPELAETTIVISGSLNAETVRELLLPTQNRLPLDAAAPSATV